MLRWLLHGLRLVAAALSFFLVPLTLMVAVDAVGGRGTLERMGKAGGVLVAAFFLCGLYATFRLLGRSPRRESPEAEVRRLRELGMLVEREFRVKRAFEVEDPHASQYVCELDDGSCILLRGQFLWDYEHVWSWRGLTRRFPCTRFILQELAGSRRLVGLVCLGEPLEPEAVAPPFTADESFDQELFDGEVTFVERPYAELEHVLFHERPIQSKE